MVSKMVSIKDIVKILFEIRSEGYGQESQFATVQEWEDEAERLILRHTKNQAYMATKGKELYTAAKNMFYIESFMEGATFTRVEKKEWMHKLSITKTVLHDTVEEIQEHFRKEPK